MRVLLGEVMVDFGSLFSLSQSKRLERLAGWCNSYRPEIDAVDDLTRQAFEAGFKKGAYEAKPGTNVLELWKRYVNTQKGLG